MKVERITMKKHKKTMLSTLILGCAGLLISLGQFISSSAYAVDLSEIKGARSCVVPGDHPSVQCYTYTDQPNCSSSTQRKNVCNSMNSEACNSSETESTINCANDGAADFCGGAGYECTGSENNWSWRALPGSLRNECGKFQNVVSSGQQADSNCAQAEPGD